MTKTTLRTYDELTHAFEHFNRELFAGKLPPCLITMQRKAKAYGYFAGGRFGSRDGQEVTDEIALNPSHFKNRSIEDSLSTLVHEMTHLEQHHFGKPSRSGYHNKQWAGLMKAVGLMPSASGEPGGKETGQNMTHYIAKGGRFDVSCRALIAAGFSFSLVELWGDADGKTRAKKAASKTKYTCGTCGANAWAKPDTKLMCGDCYHEDETPVLMEAEPAEKESES